MVSLKQRQSGFTIVELLIVIVIIGILATLIIVTFSGIQQKARDTQRKTDINALQSHVEAYYAQKGNYPTLAQLNDDAWRHANMKGLDDDALTAPNQTTKPTAATATKDIYQYAPTHDDGTTACSSADVNTDDPDCSKFTVSALQESDSTVFSKSSN
jgi:prepilin-type N-terminal cleavage/methylation domain-containing protein